MDAATNAMNSSRMTGSHFLVVRHGPRPTGNSKRKKEVLMQQAGIDCSSLVMKESRKGSSYS
jgi:hypothetical protein